MELSPHRPGTLSLISLGGDLFWMSLAEFLMNSRYCGQALVSCKHYVAQTVVIKFCAT